ncbi:MAG: Lrp/AsnC family transcriptional regulator [Thermoplasmata archaeon]
MDIIERLRKGIAITEDPYGDLAKEIGIPKESLIREIRDYMENGVIDGFRVLADQNKLGYRVNALVAMKMDDCECNMFLENPNISHFYRRKEEKDFPYNYFAMVHCRNDDCLKKFSEELKKRNIPHVIMRTLKDLKGEKRNVHSSDA